MEKSVPLNKNIMKSDKDFTLDHIFKFQTTIPTKKINVNGVRYTVHETNKYHDCQKSCCFKTIGSNCPTFPGHKRPVCFAINRLDKKSVYFTEYKRR